MKGFITGILIICLSCKTVTAVTLVNPSTAGDTVYFLENTAVNTILKVFTASTGASSYSWSLGTCSTTLFQLQTAASLSLNSNQQGLQLKSQLDYETTQSHTCIVNVWESGSTASVTMTISVVNVFDVTPTFNVASLTVTCVEEVAKDTACTTSAFTITDVETTYSSDRDVLTCSLSGTPYYYSDSSCTIKAVSVVDREKLSPNTFNGYLYVTDRGGNTASVTYTLTVSDINDNPPICKTPYAASIPESTVATTVILTIAKCTDADLSPNSDLVYATGNVPSAFLMTDTGTSFDLKLATTQDYDTMTTNPIQFNLIVYDKGVPSLNTSISVTVEITGVNDNAPIWQTWTPTLQFPNTSTNSLGENPAAGALLFTAAAKDNDKSGEPDSTIQYSCFSAQTDKGNSILSALQCDPSSGAVYIGNPSVWDRETMSYVDIVMKAQDGGSPVQSVTAQVRIAVIGVNEFYPTFSPSAQLSVTLDDRAASGTNVVLLSVTDADLPSTTIVCTLSDANFKMASTGSFQIQTNILITPDYPTSTAQNFIIKPVCTDEGGTGNPSTATIAIRINLKNNFTPVFNVSQYTLATNEDTVPGTSLLALSTTDNDAGMDGKVTCSITSPSGNPFGLDGCKSLILGGSLDYETQTSWVLSLEVKDGGVAATGGALSSTTTITVNVGNVDDNAPFCNTSAYVASIAENSAQGTTVLTVTCQDYDLQTWRFSIPTSSVPFQIANTAATNTANAVVQVGSGTLDYEQKTAWSFVVQISDQGSQLRTATANVVVQVQNVNEFTPTFTSKTVSVAEDFLVGSQITTFVAVDNDAGSYGTVTYTLLSVTNGATSDFSIDSTGAVYLLTSLDYEKTTSYVLQVKGQDGGGLSSTNSLTISVTDVNDNAPICSQGGYAFTILENSITNTLVAGSPSISATDADSSSPNNVVYYAIASGDSVGVFQINSNTAVISKSATGSLDYETTSSYILKVRAYDGGTPSQSTTCNVAITVRDVNEFDPLFAPSLYIFTVAESSTAGTSLGLVNATDADKSDIVAFYISPTSSIFGVHPSSGAVSLISTVSYDTGPFNYSFIVYASDQKGKSSTATVSVYVTAVDNYSPVCDPYDTTVNVNEAGTTPVDITTLSCSDADKGEYLTYTVTYVGATAGSGTYSFVGAALKTNTVLNYDSPDFTKSQVLLVRVLDSGTVNGPKSITVTVTILVVPVNEFSPVVASATFTVSETAAVGTAVGNVTGTDADFGSNHATLTWSIVSGDNSNNFKIDGTSGQITTVKTLDYQTSQSYNLVIRAADGGGLVGSNTITVSVTDLNNHPPVFLPTSYVLSLPSTTATGFNVLDFTGKVSDPDAGTTLTLTVTPTGTFSMSSLILQTATTLNYNSNPVYNVFVVASDGTFSTSAIVIINVTPINSYTPSITSANTVSVNEDVAVGTGFFTVVGQDSDTTGTAGVLSYAINGGDPNGYFYISSSGIVTIAKALDYETITQYVLTMTATDKGDPLKNVNQTLTVNVNDVNDNSPVFPSGFNNFNPYIDENTPVSTIATTVTVTDADSGANGQVTVSIASQSGNPQIFTYSTATKQILTTSSPDRERDSIYYVLMQAVDGGATPRTTQQLYTIRINDLNDNTPAYNPSTVVANISENQPAGYNVGTYQASDPDIGNNALLVYSLTPVPSATQPFAVDSTNGIVTTTAILDRETTSMYVMYVKARDSGTTFLTGSMLLTIYVDDQNDNSPVFTLSTYSGFISEGATGGTVAATVIATDADIGVNALIKYSILSGNTNSVFDINNGGQIFLVNNYTLDRETNYYYVLRVQAADSGAPLTVPATSTVIITIGDINDNPPVFSAANYFRSVYENQPAGTYVGTPVTATDADFGANAIITYTISMISGPLDFDIVSSTGQIRVLNAIDRETRDTYVLLITGTDGGTPTLSGTATVTISILDLNDNAPQFTQNSYNTSVYENATAGTVILTVLATDADISNNGVVRYSIVSGVLNGTIASTFFAMGSASGSLSVTTPPDREVYSMFTFYILAQDLGTTPLSASVLTIVYVIDVNEFNPAWSKSIYNGEIAYTDTRTTIILTTKATDADATGNTITYSWSPSVTLFDILSATGVVQRADVTSRLTDGQSVLYTARATDSADSPKYTDVKVRIDAYDPSTKTACMTLAMSEVNFLNSISTIIPQLASSIQSFYPSARVGLYKSVADTSSGQDWVKACFYAVSDNSTDSLGNINNDKTFLTSDKLLVYWRQNTQYEAASENLKSAVNPTTVIRVMSYSDSSIDSPSNTTSPWYQQPWGIAVLTVGSILTATCIALSTYGIYALATHNAVPSTVGASTSTNAIPKTFTVDPAAGKETLTASNLSQAQSSHAPPNRLSAPQRMDNTVWHDKTQKLWRGTPSPGLGKAQVSRLGVTPQASPTPLDLGGVNF